MSKAQIGNAVVSVVGDANNDGVGGLAFQTYGLSENLD